MEIVTEFSVGPVGYRLAIDEENPKEALHQAIALSNPRSICNECGHTGLAEKQMTTNRTSEGYLYIKVECPCGPRSTLGEYRSGGYFWKEYQVYEGQTDDEQPGNQVEQRQPRESNDGQRITAEGVTAMSEMFGSLEWSTQEVQKWLQTEHNVDRISKLSVGAGRRAYKQLQDELKKVTPF